jgi:hypothetical protein
LVEVWGERKHNDDNAAAGPRADKKKKKTQTRAALPSLERTRAGFFSL